MGNTLELNTDDTSVNFRHTAAKDITMLTLDA